MAMFEKTFKSLQKRTSEITGQLGNVLAAANERPGKAANDLEDLCLDASDDGFGSPLSGQVLVHYKVQNGEEGDKEGAAFMLPEMERAAEGLVTVGMVRSNFVLPGRYHFRFKTPDSAFGFVWVDLNDDSDMVPVLKGVVFLKALRLPGDGEVARPSSGYYGSAAASQGSASASPQASSNDLASLDLGGPAASPAASTPYAAPSPASDLMDFGSASPASPTGSSNTSRCRPAATPPSTPVVMPNRDQCVAKREAEVARRVAAAAEQAKNAAEKEAAAKAAKVEYGNKLGAELDKWAKTGDGQNWKDVRTLLSTVHTVVWKDSGWKEVGLADLLAPGAIKKTYRKAIIITHPDRHQDADFEQQFRADRIFNALNESFKLCDNP